MTELVRFLAQQEAGHVKRDRLAFAAVVDMADEVPRTKNFSLGAFPYNSNSQYSKISSLDLASWLSTTMIGESSGCFRISTGVS
jgi:hypothetical protein